MLAKTMSFVRWLVVFALVSAFLTWVWPTWYRWDHMTVDGNVVPVRIHRLSGEADMLLPDEGWVPVEAPQEGNAEPVPSGRS